jgi:hypothetical protein
LGSFNIDRKELLFYYPEKTVSATNEVVAPSKMTKKSFCEVMAHRNDGNLHKQARSLLNQHRFMNIYAVILES